MCSRKSKKVSKIAFFTCHQWGRSSGQEQVISMGMAIHTQPALPLGLGFGLVSVPTVQADVYVVGGKLHLVTDLAFFSLKKKKKILIFPSLQAIMISRITQVTSLPSDRFSVHYFTVRLGSQLEWSWFINFISASNPYYLMHHSAP